MVERRSVPALPWVLCALALGLMIASAWLRWLYPEPQEDWLTGTVTALGFAGIAVVGALIASRLPGNVYGWLWLAAGLVYGPVDGIRPLTLLLGAPAWIAWLVSAAGFISLLTLLFFVFLLFPTGRLPSPRWRLVADVAVVLPLLVFATAVLIADPDHPDAAPPWAVEGAAARTLGRLAEFGLGLLFLLVLLGMVSTVLRFHRADPVERRQLAWFMYAAVVNGVLLALDARGLIPDYLVMHLVSEGCLLLLPAAVGFAMLRYRLYDIDRIVSRTVTYGLLTAGIFAVYVLLVTVPPLLGFQRRTPDVVVAAVTLAAAAVVGPARRRLQATVDRRFDRARYDASRAVEAFAVRLREQVDLDEVVGAMRDTVGATVTPQRVSVWLRPAERR